MAKPPANAAAANARAAPARAAAAPAAAAQQGWPFKPALLLILLLPAAVLMAPTAIVLVAALMPTVAARLIDPTPGRYLTLTVLGMNLVGSFYFLHQLWSMGEDFGAIGLVLGDAIGWLCCFAGAGCGWLLYLAMPAMVAKMAAGQSALRMRRVRRDLAQLTEEWGPGVAGDRRQ